MTRFFFIHCSKTGGTSLNNQLRGIFHKNETYPRQKDKQKGVEAITNLDFMRSTLETRPEVKFVTGHFPYFAHELIGTDVKTFTILREPVERTLSALRFDRKLYNPNQTLEEIYSHPRRFLFRFQNPMVKLFSLSNNGNPLGLLQAVDFTEDHLIKARRNLRKVDVIGVTENYAEFCSELSKEFGWDLGRIRHDNQTKKDEVPPAFLKRIKRDNLLDIRFYRSALKIIENRRKRPAKRTT